VKKDHEEAFCKINLLYEQKWMLTEKRYSASRSTDDKITDITSNTLHRTQKIASETANKIG